MKTRDWDVADYLNSEEDRVAFLNAILEDGDPALYQAALGAVARSMGMSKVASETGLGRERAESSPTFATIMKVANAVGAPLAARTPELVAA
jgi:probable addiction module antidote protein